MVGVDTEAEHDDALRRRMPADDEQAAERETKRDFGIGAGAVVTKQ